MPVQFHPLAEQEVTEAAAYYENSREGLGREFRLEFEAALARLMEQPHLYATAIGAFRGCMLHRFPYTIFYCDMDDGIWIVAVAHQKRRPGYWSRRKVKKR